MSRSSLALVNPRAVVILIVLALHSALPYLASLPPARIRSTASMAGELRPRDCMRLYAAYAYTLGLN